MAMPTSKGMTNPPTSPKGVKTIKGKPKGMATPGRKSDGTPNRTK